MKFGWQDVGRESCNAEILAYRLCRFIAYTEVATGSVFSDAKTRIEVLSED